MATKATTVTTAATNNTTGVALAKVAAHTAPANTVQPVAAPQLAFAIAATPYTGKGAPALPTPKAGTVFAACLAAIGNQGCTLASMQLAINALGLRGAHPAMAMLRYAAKHWGYAFVCTAGVVQLA